MRSRGFWGLLILSFLSFLNLSGCSYISGGQQAPVSSIQTLGSSTYIVQAGDTIEGISDGFDLSVGQLALWNHLNPPYSLTMGQKLWVRAPSKDQLNTVNQPNQANQASHSKEPLLQSMEPGLVMPVQKTVSNSAPANNSMAVNSVPNHVAPEIQMPKISASGWMWPMQGHVMSDPEGGVDIQSKTHTNIVAAKAGKVIYAGPDINGDGGKLVILDQGDGFLSAYGNLQAIQTKEGASLSRAETIGYVKDVLHFEIRQSGTSVDVAKYLPVE